MSDYTQKTIAYYNSAKKEADRLCESIRKFYNEHRYDDDLEVMMVKEFEEKRNMFIETTKNNVPLRSETYIKEEAAASLDLWTALGPLYYNVSVCPFEPESLAKK